jgi:hypothetical protein
LLFYNPLVGLNSKKWPRRLVTKRASSARRQTQQGSWDHIAHDAKENPHKQGNSEGLPVAKESHQTRNAYTGQTDEYTEEQQTTSDKSQA